MARRPEDELFERFRRCREPAALAVVFDRTAADLLRVALHLCGRRADAEDVVQQTFLVAIERAASWDRTRGLFPWLVGILTNQARLRRRAEGRVPDAGRLGDRAGGVLADDPHLLAQRAETAAAIERAVAELGEVYGPVLRLHLDHGLNGKEIAHALGRPAGTVRTQLVRGLEQLRRALPSGLGVVAAATAMGTGRGLAAVREVVLANARDVAAAAGAAGGGTAAVSLLLGAFTMHKLWMLSCAAVVLFAMWWSMSPPDPSAPQLAAAGVSVEAAVADAAQRGSRERDGAAAVPDALADRVAAPAPTGSLRVRVRGVVGLPGSVGEERNVLASSPGGEPMAGVLVQYWPGTSDELPFDGSLRAQRTDVSGDVVFDAVPCGPARCRLRLSLAGPGNEARLVVIADAGETVCDVELSMAARVRGLVVDDDGTAVAGAEVWTSSSMQLGGTNMPPEEMLRRAAVTDAAGAFAFTRSAVEHHAGARLPGRGVSRWQPTDLLGAGEIVLRLCREQGTVRGRVVDATGRGVDGAVIGIERRGRSLLTRAPDGSMAGRAVLLLLRSDESGRFGPENLPPGRYAARVTAPALGEAHATFDVAAFGTETLHVQMAAAITLVATVRDADGEALPSVMAWVTMPDGGSMTAVASGSGRVVFQRVPAQPFVLEAGWTGADSSRARRTFAPPFEGVRDGVLHAELALHERPGIRGRVLADGDVPLAQWWVAALQGDIVLRTTQTAGDGSFDLRDLRPGRHRVATVRRGGDWDAAGAERAGIEPGTDGVELRVSRTALPTNEVRGRVVDDLGAAIAGVTVSVHAGLGHLLPPGQSDADGRFVVTGLHSSGSYTVTFLAVGHRVRSDSVEVGDRVTVDLGDVVLAREVPVRVRFLRPDGTAWLHDLPVPHVRDHEGRLLQENYEVRFEAEGGELVLRGIAAGRYTIEPPHGDDLMFERREVVLVAGEPQRLEIATQVGRFLELQFERPPQAAQPQDAVQVQVRAAGGDIVLREELRRAPLGGSVSLGRAFAHGRYVVEATAADGLRWRGEFTAGATSARDVRVPLLR